MFFITGNKLINSSSYLKPFSMTIDEYMKLPKNTQQMLSHEEMFIPLGMSEPHEFDYYSSNLPARFPGTHLFKKGALHLPSGVHFLDKIKVPSKKGEVVNTDCILPAQTLTIKEKFLAAGSKMPYTVYGSAIEYYPHNLTLSISFLDSPTGNPTAWYNEKLYHPDIKNTFKGDLRTSKTGWKYWTDFTAAAYFPPKSQVLGVLKDAGVNIMCGSATILVNSETKQWKIANVSSTKYISPSVADLLTTSEYIAALFNKYKGQFTSTTKKMTLTPIADITSPYVDQPLEADFFEEEPDNGDN